MSSLARRGKVTSSSVPEDLKAKVAEINGDPHPDLKQESSLIGRNDLNAVQKLKKLASKTNENIEDAGISGSNGNQHSQLKQREESQSELEKFFSKTVAKPQIFYKLLTREEALQRRPQGKKGTKEEVKD